MRTLTRSLASAAGLAAVAALACTAIASGAGAESSKAITWTVTPATEAGQPAHVQFSYGMSTLGMGVAETVELARLASIGAADFTLAREAGTLSCEGHVDTAYSGSGTCRFAPDTRFAADLRARGLAPDGEREQFAMALLDVDRAFIDGLKREGVAPDSADEAIGAAALGATPAYVAELRRAGLTLRSLDDALACRALNVDAAYARAMADAGYGGDIREVIAMKAVGVTPDYARRMNAAAQK